MEFKLFILLITLSKIESSFEECIIDSRVCSKSGLDTNLIVGGVEAAPNEFPWLVLISSPLKINGQTRTHICSGSLIEMDLVVTAAHCLDAIKCKDSLVVAGEHDRCNCSGDEQYATIKEVYVHPEYGKSTKGFHDIALLRLNTSFRSTKFVKTLSILSPDYNITEDVFTTVAGWGKIKTSDTVGSKLLRKVNVTVVSEENCSNMNSTSEVCTFDENKDSCTGDSGAPLLITDPQTSDTFLYGIVSRGNDAIENCGGQPAIYTRASFYYHWTQDKSHKFVPCQANSIQNSWLIWLMLMVFFTCK